MGTALILVLLVGIGALLLRRSFAARESGLPGELDVPSGPDNPELEFEDADGDEEAAAVTSDGWAFVPRGLKVELIPPGEYDEDVEPAGLGSAFGQAPQNPRTGRRVEGWKPGQHLSPGDLIAARVKRGAPSVDPWRLEGLGRDHDYRAWAFETEDAAHAAYGLIAQRIVRPALDEDGRPIPVGDEDFMVARRKLEQTASEVSYDDFDDEIR